jgi:hypothetical protein
MGVQPERDSTIAWRKSGRSADQGNCIEVTTCPAFVQVRDSRDRSGAVLRFTHGQWRHLLGHIRSKVANYG